MEKIKLANNLSVVLKTNKNTPRIALSFYIQIAKPENKAGVYTLLNRLLWQGTKRFTSEELANVLEENAIDCYSDLKHDYIKLRLTTLNEDFETGLDILADVVKNSTLELFEKEVVKIQGEIQAELDSPKSKAMDLYYRTIFANHYYGNTSSELLKSLPQVTKEDVARAYEDILKNSRKNISIVGDISKQDVETLLNKYFNNISSNDAVEVEIQSPQLTENKYVTIKQEDATQAQIIQGWLVESIHSEDYVPLVLMNTILGSSGLSARLFLELREKKGLAYVVRSSYETYKKTATFSVYIATEPNNIKTCLDGFQKEIDKIKTIPVSDKELEDAKNNLIGKRQFILETNSQQSAVVGFYDFEELGIDYEEILIAKVKQLTSEDIMRVANKYLNQNSVTAILSPIL